MSITDFEGTTYDEDEALEIADKIIKETSNEYEKGWQDALYYAIEGTNRDIDGYIARQKYISEDKLKCLQSAHNETTLSLEREVEI